MTTTRVIRCKLTLLSSPWRNMILDYSLYNKKPYCQYVVTTYFLLNPIFRSKRWVLSDNIGNIYQKILICRKYYAVFGSFILGIWRFVPLQYQVKAVGTEARSPFKPLSPPTSSFNKQGLFKIRSDYA